MLLAQNISTSSTAAKERKFTQSAFSKGTNAKPVRSLIQVVTIVGPSLYHVGRSFCWQRCKIRNQASLAALQTVSVGSEMLAARRY